MTKITKESIAKKEALLAQFQTWLKDNPSPAYNCLDKKSIIKNAAHIFKQQAAYASIVDGHYMKYGSGWFTFRLEEAVENETNLESVFRIGRELIASYFTGTFDKRTGTFYVKKERDMNAVKNFHLRMAQLKNVHTETSWIVYDKKNHTIKTAHWTNPKTLVLNGVDTPQLIEELEKYRWNFDPRNKTLIN